MIVFIDEKLHSTEAVLTCSKCPYCIYIEECCAPSYYPCQPPKIKLQIKPCTYNCMETIMEDLASSTPAIVRVPSVTHWKRERERESHMLRSSSPDFIDIWAKVGQALPPDEQRFSQQ